MSLKRVADKADCGVADRHNAWVRALRYEYDTRISRASDCSEASFARQRPASGQDGPLALTPGRM